MVEVVVLGSGSKGNCTLVRTADAALLIDAGLSAREIGRRLLAVGQDPRRLAAVLITHEHQDHIQGVRVFVRRTPIPVCANQGTFRAAAGILWDLPELFTFENGERFDAGPFRVVPFPVPHDAADPVGFVIEAEGVRIGYATDLGHVTPLVEEHLADCTALVFESNHDSTMLMNGPYPLVTKQRVAGSLGHLSNEHAAAALPTIAATAAADVVLAHISQTNNEPRLAEAATVAALASAGCSRVRVHVARQDAPSAALRY